MGQAADATASLPARVDSGSTNFGLFGQYYFKWAGLSRTLAIGTWWARQKPSTLWPCTSLGPIQPEARPLLLAAVGGAHLTKASVKTVHVQPQWRQISSIDALLAAIARPGEEARPSYD